MARLRKLEMVSASIDHHRVLPRLSVEPVLPALPVLVQDDRPERAPLLVADPWQVVELEEPRHPGQQQEVLDLSILDCQKNDEHRFVLD